MITLGTAAPSPFCKTGLTAQATVAKCTGARFNDDGTVDSEVNFYVDQVSAFDGSEPMFTSSTQFAQGEITALSETLQIIESALVLKGGLLDSSTVRANPM